MILGSHTSHFTLPFLKVGPEYICNNCTQSFTIPALQLQFDENVQQRTERRIQERGGYERTGVKGQEEMREEGRIEGR